MVQTPSAQSYKFLTICLALIGALLIVGSVLLYPHIGKPAYGHQISEIDKTEIPQEADILNYSSLSRNGKQAFRSTVQSTDNRYTVYGKERKPPEFSYQDRSQIGNGIYFIYYKNEYYQLITSDSTSDPVFSRWIRLSKTVLAISGLMCLLTSYLLFKQKRSREPLLTLIFIISSLLIGVLATRNILWMIGAGMVLLLAPLSSFLYLTRR